MFPDITGCVRYCHSSLHYRLYTLPRYFPTLQVVYVTAIFPYIIGCICYMYRDISVYYRLYTLPRYFLYYRLCTLLSYFPTLQIVYVTAIFPYITDCIRCRDTSLYYRLYTLSRYFPTLQVMYVTCIYLHMSFITGCVRYCHISLHLADSVVDTGRHTGWPWKRNRFLPHSWSGKIEGRQCKLWCVSNFFSQLCFLSAFPVKILYISKRTAKYITTVSMLHCYDCFFF